MKTAFGVLPIRWLGDSTFLFHRLSGETDNRLEWTVLGQSIFTPENHRLRDPSVNDHPYAGWLYAGLNFVQDYNAQQLTSLQFLGGIVGPWALGRQVQNGVHSLLGQELARGWDHQLSNEFGFSASWERKWRFNHQLGDGYCGRLSLTLESPQETSSTMPKLGFCYAGDVV